MPAITSPPTGTFTGCPSHLNALIWDASRQEHRLNYSHAGCRFAEIVSDLVPFDFDEEATTWEDLLAIELSPILAALASDLEPTPDHLRQFKAWMHLRFPVVAKKIPSARWTMFARGAAQASEDGWW